MRSTGSTILEPVQNKSFMMLRRPNKNDTGRKMNWTIVSWIATLGLEDQESSGLVSMFRQYGVEGEGSQRQSKRRPVYQACCHRPLVDVDPASARHKGSGVISDEHGKFPDSLNRKMLKQKISPNWSKNRNLMIPVFFAFTRIAG